MRLPDNNVDFLSIRKRVNIVEASSQFLREIRGAVEMKMVEDLTTNKAEKDLWSAASERLFSRGPAMSSNLGMLE